jgi:hypothetical protein
LFLPADESQAGGAPETAMAHALFPHLSQERFDAARAFLEQIGRPLDAAILRHRLGEAGAAEAVLTALAPFQNADGGFGQGLEPDIQSPASSALATSIGLRLLPRAGARGDHPMVVAAVGWLDANLDRERGVWPIIGPDVDLAPHAPWWAWSEDLAASWNGFRFNPTAEILGWLYIYRDHYRAAVPGEMIAAVEAGLRRTLAEAELIEGAYDLKCAVGLAEGLGAPDDLAGPLELLVRRSLVAHDPTLRLKTAAGPRSGTGASSTPKPGQGPPRLAELPDARGARDAAEMGAGGVGVTEKGARDVRSNGTRRPACEAASVRPTSIRVSPYRR